MGKGAHRKAGATSHRRPRPRPARWTLVWRGAVVTAVAVPLLTVAGNAVPMVLAGNPAPTSGPVLADVGGQMAAHHAHHMHHLACLAAQAAGVPVSC